MRKHDPYPGSYWLYGAHAVNAALANHERRVKRLLVTRNAQEKLSSAWNAARHPQPEMTDPHAMERHVPPDAVHQGIAAEVLPLAPVPLADVLAVAEKRPLLLLDQVTDPHNVGAILRSSAAFGAAAVIQTDAHAPPESAAMAKAASGGLEIVPLVRVTNLAAAIGLIKEAGWWVAGLDGEAGQALHETKLGADTALVLGAEGKGMRRLTAERCDLLVRLPIHPRMESLNVSNAAAVALYALTLRG